MFARSFMTFVMLSIFSVMLWIGWGYPPAARFMILVVGVPAVALCVLQLVLDLTKNAPPPKPAAEFAAIEGEQTLPPETMIRREIIMWTYFLSFMGLILFFGFWIAIPILLFTFLTFMANVKWTNSLLTTIISTVAIYGFFEALLEMRLHRGFLMPQLLEGLEKYEVLAPFLKLLS